MKDIGTIEKRIENLEYYTSLSLLEQSTVSKQDLTILDSQNLPRFKNGIIVDSFTGSGVADVAQPDYHASIDSKLQELRPSFTTSAVTLEFDSANSSGFTQNGTSLVVSTTDTPFIDQSKASKASNINPFNITNYIGKIAIDPTTDIWLDTNRQPDVVINLGGSADAWNRITSLTSSYDYVWGSWENHWTGTSTEVQSFQTRTGNLGFWGGDGNTSGMAQIIDTYQTTTTQTGTSTRSGVVATVVPETITQNIGDRLVDLSIIPYMRTKGIVIVATDFKPNVTLFPFLIQLLLKHLQLVLINLHYKTIILVTEQKLVILNK